MRVTKRSMKFSVLYGFGIGAELIVGKADRSRSAIWVSRYRLRTWDLQRQPFL